jgi:hypothetical protein
MPGKISKSALKESRMLDHVCEIMSNIFDRITMDK